MSLHNGRPYLAIPGPSVMPDRVLQAMHQPSPNIYYGELVDMVGGLAKDLRTVACVPDGHVAMYITNGHGTWEAALANTVAPGDRILVLATGTFGEWWANTARAMGITVDLLNFGLQDTIDPDRVADHLRADTAHAIKAVLMVHVDTATSIRNDVPAIRAAIDAVNHPALFMVDCVASMACDRFEMQNWGADVAIAASQKGLMTPPGMGFVYFNDKAHEVRKTLGQVSPTWDWTPRGFPENFYRYFGGTPPTHHLFGLREALNMIVHEEGLENVWARHAKLAQTIWAAVDAWGEGGDIACNIAPHHLRSHAVTTIRMQTPNATALRDWVSDKAGITLGISMGLADPGDPAWHGIFRIGHMGHVNAHMIMGVLGCLQAGMSALKIPYGDGALDAAAAVIAQA